MSKKKSVGLGKILNLVAIAFGVVAIAMIFVTSMNINGSVFGLEGTTSFTGLDVVFGMSEGDVTFIEFSFLNLLPYVLLVVAVILLILSLLGVVKKNLVNYVAALLMIVAGVLFFLTVNFTILNEAFQSAIDLVNIAKELVTKTLGVGAIVAGIASILGGLVVIGGTVKAKK